jgi:hypothetical protein
MNNKNTQTKTNNRLQVRCQFDEHRLHVQGVSAEHKTNREYGCAHELRVPTQVTTWLGQKDPELKSAASSSVLYVPLHLWATPEGYQFFIKGSEFNHPDGLVLNVHPDNLSVKALIDFAQDGGIDVTMQAEHYTSDGGEEE